MAGRGHNGVDKGQADHRSSFPNERPDIPTSLRSCCVCWWLMNGIRNGPLGACCCPTFKLLPVGGTDHVFGNSVFLFAKELAGSRAGCVPRAAKETVGLRGRELHVRCMGCMLVSAKELAGLRGGELSDTCTGCGILSAKELVDLRDGELIGGFASCPLLSAKGLLGWRGGELQGPKPSGMRLRQLDSEDVLPVSGDDCGLPL